MSKCNFLVYFFNLDNYRLLFYQTLKTLTEGKKLYKIQTVYLSSRNNLHICISNYGGKSAHAL